MTIQAIEAKLNEAYQNLAYWYAYNHPVTGVSNANIRSADENVKDWTLALKAAKAIARTC